MKRSSPIKKEATLREQVFQVLVSELKSARFAPGERITEEGLAKRLGVSRTPIREALGQLTKQGILRARDGGGYVVPSPSIEEIRQIIAVRRLLEPVAVRMAAEEYGPAEIERISKSIAAESRATPRVSPGMFAKANEDFRHAIFDAISNQVLSSVIAQFAGHLHFIRGATLSDLELRREIVSRQQAIRDALAQRDADRAEDLWRSYLDLTEAALTKAMTDLTRRAASSAREAAKAADAA
jgi:DNA-binding GntR family transcriptional regulator